ncbi:transposase [Shewanella sp. WXL01]|uniref:transposase n=1 Tax=Shewanella sp. WXL01 TaxID=2709721 RepID=UPI0014385D55|nr:transposase [Shewanella sp. WXL01]NKF49429.1 transposase [Shewanella sp. WXL01]
MQNLTTKAPIASENTKVSDNENNSLTSLLNRASSAESRNTQVTASRRHHEISMQQTLVYEVIHHNKLVSHVAKEHGISSKKLYQWVKAAQSSANDSKQQQCEQLNLQIAQLQQQLVSLNHQLHALQA